MNITKTQKSFNEHNFQVELEELQKKIAPLVMEQRMLLKEVDAKDLLSFETAMQLKTGYVKPSINAELLGFEIQHFRLTELEHILDGKLQDEDVAKDGKIKAKKVQEIKDKHITFYNDDELEALKLINDAIDSYNKIPQQYKNRVIIDRLGIMQHNPFIRF